MFWHYQQEQMHTRKQEEITMAKKKSKGVLQSIHEEEQLENKIFNLLKAYQFIIYQVEKDKFLTEGYLLKNPFEKPWHDEMMDAAREVKEYASRLRQARQITSMNDFMEDLMAKKKTTKKTKPTKKY
jgi:hypothetical protein